MSRLSAMLCLIAAMSMTGANVPLVKLLVAEIPPGVLLALRFACASAVLAAVAHREPGPQLRALERRDWLAIGVLGIVGSVLFTWAVLEGVRRTTGASAGIILAALPAVVAAVGLMFGDRLKRGEVVMIALAVAGVAMIQGQSMPDPTANAGSSPLIGNLLIGCAVVCEAAFVIVARGISGRLAPFRLSLGVALVSLVACVPAGVAGLMAFDLRSIGAATWCLFAWYTLTASVLCTALWYRGVAHVERWAAGLATAAVPVSALAVSVLVLDERIELAQLAGAALVVTAIVMGTLSRR